MIACVGSELVANSGPGFGIDQRRMLAGVELTLVGNLTGVNGIREQLVDVPARERFATALGAVRRRAAFCDEPEAVGLFLDPAHAAELTIKDEYTAYRLRLGMVDNERALARVVAERRVTAHPHALLLRGGDLVADPFAGDLPLELGKGQQHIEGQPPDLVDDDDVDPASLDVGKQLLQCRPLHVATREPAVVVAGSGQYPALVTLAADIGLAGFALRLERVELLLEPFLGGFAGVDRAAFPARVTPRHRSPPSVRRRVPMLAMTGSLPIGFVSARRTADPTTPCR